jgi:hypothetical protein
MAIQTIPPGALTRPYDYILAQYSVTSGTTAEAITVNTWTSRNLNTLVTDTSGNASLASNLLTIPAGTYEYSAISSSWASSAVTGRTRLWNNTDSSTIGVSLAASTVAGGSVYTEARGRFTIAGSKALAVQTYQNVTGNGGGPLSVASTNEIYVQLELRRIGP